MKEIFSIDLFFVFTENPEGGVASGDEALSILENTSSRNVFIDELMEVIIFKV